MSKEIERLRAFVESVDEAVGEAMAQAEGIADKVFGGIYEALDSLTEPEPVDEGIKIGDTVKIVKPPTHQYLGQTGVVQTIEPDVIDEVDRLVRIKFTDKDTTTYVFMSHIEPVKEKSKTRLVDEIIEMLRAKGDNFMAEKWMNASMNDQPYDYVRTVWERLKRGGSR